MSIQLETWRFGNSRSKIIPWLPVCLSNKIIIYEKHHIIKSNWTHINGNFNHVPSCLCDHYVIQNKKNWVRVIYNLISNQT